MSSMERLVILIVLVLIIVTVIYFLSKKPKISGIPADGVIQNILQSHVLFYQQLNAERKAVFENRVRNFLQKVRITGIKTSLEDIDKVFTAAAAIIPVFAFDTWEYRNIHEVLLYPGAFTESFNIDGEGRNVSGMVGNGPMQQVMVLSQTDLRNDFLQPTGASNTGIHEFVHLIDKIDGATDGSLDMLLPHQYALPWLKRIHQEIALIQAGHSDINPYGATNEAEFLAVAAEYFFEQPHRMRC
jgi:Mlc titration factor MtfA (ptsG expression regulator)